MNMLWCAFGRRGSRSVLRYLLFALIVLGASSFLLSPLPHGSTCNTSNCLRSSHNFQVPPATISSHASAHTFGLFSGAHVQIENHEPHSLSSTMTMKIRNFYVKRLRALQNLMLRFHTQRERLRKLILMSVVFLSISFSAFFSGPALAAGSGGRMRGSFKPSSRPSMSRPYRGSYSSSGLSRSRPTPCAPPNRLYRTYRPPHYRRPPVVVHHDVDEAAPVQVYSTFNGPSRRRISASEVLVFGAAATIVASKVSEVEANRDDRRSRTASPLGPGFSVASITVAVDIPNRDDPSCILSKLADRAISSNTSTRSGLQRTISRTALDLLRLDSSITSVDSSYNHFSDFDDAEVAFNRLSTYHRSKFDRETVNLVDGEDQADARMCDDGENDEEATASDSAPTHQSTKAVVTLNIVIEGDSTKFRKIRTRSQLREALSKISADSEVGDCLVSGELMWTPEERSDYLTEEDLFVEYPSLYPL